MTSAQLASTALTVVHEHLAPAINHYIQSLLGLMKLLGEMQNKTESAGNKAQKAHESDNQSA